MTTIKDRDPYEILQVSKNAEKEVIDAAYKRLARKYHPDANKAPNAEQMMKDLNWAYEIVGDSNKRKEYDQDESTRKQSYAQQSQKVDQRENENSSYRYSNDNSKTAENISSKYGKYSYTEKKNSNTVYTNTNPQNYFSRNKKAILLILCVSFLALLIIGSVIQTNNSSGRKSEKRNIQTTALPIILTIDNSSTPTINPTPKVELAATLIGGGNGKALVIADLDSTYDNIFEVNLYKDEYRKIVINTYSNYSPDVSSDGSKVVFEIFNKYPSLSDLAIINMDGSGFNNITRDQSGSHSPKWSHDGTKIVYILNCKVHIMNSDGTNRRSLGQIGDCANEPDWSPDGKKIVFSVKTNDLSQIYSMNSDGSSITQLTYTNGNNLNPDWSPIENKIVFTSGRDGIAQIYVMNGDGSNQKNVSNNNFSEMHPTWSPDGKIIALCSNMDAIYLLDPESQERFQLSDNDILGCSLIWEP